MTVLGPPPLPMRFPCWVRAVYSWGGEGKRDLGFMEGDLIECLNAGDGSWWTGRLFRDRRMVGSFPSNFVEVLPEDFRPITRSVSPLPANNTPPKAAPQKSRTFRKPFEAYAKAPHYTTAKQPETFMPGSTRTRDASANSIDSTGSGRATTAAARRAQNQSQNAHYAVQHSRNNSNATLLSRAPSPLPPQQSYQHQQQQPQQPRSYSRSPSPLPPRMASYTQESVQVSQPPPQQLVYQHQLPGQQQQHYQPQQQYDYAGQYQPPPPQPSHYQSQQSQSFSQPFAQPQQYYPPSPSPAPHQMHRQPSPAPSMNMNAVQHVRPDAMPDTPGGYQPYRPPSVGGQPLDSPPPPPPPPHRHAIRNGSHDSYGSQAQTPVRMPTDRDGSGLSYNSHAVHGHGFHTPRAASPMPHSPGGGETGMTPSPLREAMDDVMEQLHTLGMSRDEARTPDDLAPASAPTSTPAPAPAPTPAAFDPWSPDSLGTMQQKSRRQMLKEQASRPQTSMGLASAVDEGYETYSGSGHSQNSTRGDDTDENLPQLSNYVERMESRLRTMHNKHQQMHAPAAPAAAVSDEAFVDDEPPMPPPKRMTLFDRPKSSMGGATDSTGGTESTAKQLRHRRSAYEVGRQALSRTFTTKTNSTNASSGNQSTATDSSHSSTNTQSTNRSLMSGASASALSATSAGSLARKNQSRAQSAMGMRAWDGDERPDSPFTGVTYHSSHATDYQGATPGTTLTSTPTTTPTTPGRMQRPKSQAGFHSNNDDLPGLGGMTGLGGLAAPKSPKKGTNIFKKIIESAKTGVASSRGSIAMTGFGSGHKSSGGVSGMSGMSGMSGISSSNMANMASPAQGRAREMGLGGASGSSVDWVQVRRDVNRSNSLSRIERNERRDRCQMLDYPALDPVDELYNTIDGNEGADGMPVAEPTNYHVLNLSQVDKNSRFIAGLPPTTTSVSLATTYVCRPYRSDVQRLRAIFTWVAEKVVWEDDYETGSEAGIDTRRVIQTKRGCAEEYAVLVAEMCAAAGLACEVVRGYLKAPGDIPELGIMPRSNHYWNAVVVDGEWRIMDCCLASPSFPRRSVYASGAGSSTAADPWWFLVQPSEACYTHIPEHHSQQHLCPPVAHETLQNLPCAGAPYFRNGLQLMDYNTSLLRIEDLEMVHVRFSVPEDVEIAAEVEVRALSRDADGDLFESGDVIRKRALAQADWIAGGIKRYTVKGVLPGDEGTGILKVYAGKRGLMHSIKDIPHPLAFSLPVVHTGENPAYEFVLRHPTPHAQRHDIYVVQPQCQRLALNNTFVFAIRQHPSSLGTGQATPVLGSGRAPSPSPFARPSSAMSMLSTATSGFGAGNHSNMVSNMVPATSSVSGSSTTSSGGSSGKKPAKLAIQTPGGKILRLMRKEERKGGAVSAGTAGRGDDEAADGGTWETIIKCSERGVWRGLVLADRTARWCVFAEWVCQ